MGMGQGGCASGIPVNMFLELQTRGCEVSIYKYERSNFCFVFKTGKRTVLIY